MIREEIEGIKARIVETIVGIKFPCLECDAELVFYESLEQRSVVFDQLVYCAKCKTKYDIHINAQIGVSGNTVPPKLKKITK